MKSRIIDSTWIAVALGAVATVVVQKFDPMLFGGIRWSNAKHRKSKMPPPATA
jgi:hypothetical protein